MGMFQTLTMNLVLNLDNAKVDIARPRDTRREPVVRIYDRAGNFDEVSPGK